MKSKVLILVLALVMGAVATFFAINYLNSATRRLEADAEPVEVLVAAEDIPRGMSAEELIEKKLIVTEEIPRMYVSSGAVSSVGSIEGQVVSSPLSKGEQVTLTRFQYSAQAGLSYGVPEGFVAVAIPSDAVKGVAGLLKPNDTVMVAATFKPGPNGEEALTKVLLPKARVLAVGTSVGAEAQDEEIKTTGVLGGNSSSNDEEKIASTVTLALTPADLEKLIYAEEQGSVWLALLPATATEIPATAGRSLATVYQ